MLIFLVKAIAVFLAAISISKSYIDYKKHQEPRVMFIFWSVIWLSAATIVVYPLLIDTIIIYTKDSTITIGSLISVAFIFLLYIVYRIYTKAARIEYQQTELIRQIGLLKSQTKKK